MKEERMVAARYKKIQFDTIDENIYLYVFKDVVTDIIEYDAYDDTIKYVKKGKEKVLFEIENPYFVVSDEKYGFCDLLYIDELKDRYEKYAKTEEECLKLYEQECRSFFRICIFDEKTECTKLLHSSKKELLKAKPDNEFLDFSIFLNTEYDQQAISLPLSGVDLLVEQLASGDLKLLQNTLKTMKEAANEVLKSTEKEKAIEKKEEKKNLKSLEKELNSLIGLNNIKEEIEKLKIYLQFIDKVKDKTNIGDLNLNMMFTGNSGTGKTTVARIVADMLYNLGYTENQNFLEVTANDFIAEYIGQTAEKTKELLEDGRGGVIFIDEAYAFNDNHYAQDALAEIVKEMDELKTIFIFAGYKKEMKDFLKTNSGLKSRISRTFDFDDYTLDELFQIFERKLKITKFRMGDTAKLKVKKIIAENKDEDNFGNARYIDELFEKLLINHAYNTKDKESINSLKTLHIEDTKGLGKPLPDREEELNNLIGLENVKKMVIELKALLEYQRQMNTDRDLRLNMIFTGNPGTGKTTVARIIAHILYKYGYVKKPKFVETTARDFIGDYVGQTAGKARKLIKKNRGGVIFIDEAYTFASPSQHYAQEALEEILKEMEDKDTIFIFAGYTEEMKQFIDMNSGLESRIGNPIEFKDYTEEELYEMFKLKLKDSKLVIDDDAKMKIMQIIEENIGTKHFGNGRFIDQLFDILIRKHAYNCYQTKSSEDLRTIKLEDTIELSDVLKGSKVKKLGF